MAVDAWWANGGGATWRRRKNAWQRKNVIRRAGHAPGNIRTRAGGDGALRAVTGARGSKATVKRQRPTSCGIARGKTLAARVIAVARKIAAFWRGRGTLSAQHRKQKSGWRVAATSFLPQKAK